jgi:hypothetical protein
MIDAHAVLCRFPPSRPGPPNPNPRKDPAC